MHPQPPPAPRGSPVPGVIPEPVHIVEDTGGGNAGRLAAPRRRHPVTYLLARLLSVIRGDKHMADAAAPTLPAPHEVARPVVHGNVPAGDHPAGKLDATSGPRAPRTGSQAGEG